VRCHRRDEPVAAPRDRLDVFRRPGVVPQRLPQLGDGLRQRVVGDVGVRPEGVEQVFLGDQLAGVIDEVEQEIEELRREIDRRTAPRDAVRRSIDTKRPEDVIR
jgi:hypothetical protein